MDKLRGLVRPVLSLAFSGITLLLGIYLVVKFGTADMARDYSIFILATGATIIGFWFGQRKGNQ